MAFPDKRIIFNETSWRFKRGKRRMADSRSFVLVSLLPFAPFQYFFAPEGATVTEDSVEARLNDQLTRNL